MNKKLPVSYGVETFLYTKTPQTLEIQEFAGFEKQKQSNVKKLTRVELKRP